MRLLALLFLLVAQASASVLPLSWVPDGQVYKVAVDSGTVYVGGAFRNMVPRTGSGAIVDPASAVNLTSVLAINNEVSCAVADGAGGWYIAGGFTKVLGQKRFHLAHLSASGALDPNFAPWTTGSVTALAYDSGILYVGGYLTEINGQARGSVAALDTSGALLSWAPQVSRSGNDSTHINALTVYAGKVYIAGDFDQVNGQPRQSLVAVDLAGTLDVWDPQISTSSTYKSVTSVVPLGGQLYVAGSFTSAQGQLRNGLAAFDGAGFLSAWDPAATASSNPTVYAMVGAGSTLYLAGYNLNGVGGASLSSGLMAVGAGTGLSTGFAPANGSWQTLAVNGSSVYAGGWNYWTYTIPRAYAAAFDATTGALLAWEPKPSYAVECLAVSGSRIFIGGAFGGIGTTAVSRSGLAAFSTSGNLLAWAPALTLTSGSWSGAQVRDMVILPGSLVAAGDFDGVGATMRRSIVSLDRSSGAVNTAFDAGLAYSNWAAQCLTYTGSALFLGGSFSSAGGQARTNLAALDPATGAALAFNSNVDGTVSRLAAGNGKLYLAGSFTQLNGSNRPGLGALDPASGALDSFDPVTFTVSNGQAVNALLPYGSDLFIGGSFSAVNGSPRQSVARLDSGGASQSFNAQLGSSSTVYDLVMHQGRLMVNGSYYQVGSLYQSSCSEFDLNSGAVGPWRPYPNGWSSYSGTAWSSASDDSQLYLTSPHTLIEGTQSSQLAFLTRDPLTAPDASEDSSAPIPTMIVGDSGGLSFNFHDVQDNADVARFSVSAGMSYLIETYALEGNCDTVLSIYDASSPTRVVAQAWNEDRAPGDLSSSVLWTATYTGEAFALVQPVDALHSGANSGYRIRVAALGSWSPTPSATISPTPTITSMPLPCSTLGYTVADTAGNVSGMEVFQGLSVSADTTANAVSVFIQSITGTASARVAVYAAQSITVPGAVLVQSAAVNLNSGWNDLALAPTALSSGVYFMALQVSGTASVWHQNPGPWNLLYRMMPWSNFVDGPFAPTSLTGVSFTAAMTLMLCQIDSPTVTPSMSPTLGLPISESPTVTMSATETGSPSPSQTETPSATPSESPSATPSPSPSETLTASPTETSSPTLTITTTPSVSSGPSDSPTPTFSPTETPSESPSATPTSSSSETLTFSPTETPSPSPTSSHSSTLTSSPSLTVTMTATLSPTITPTPSMSLTPTQSATFTLSPTPFPLGSDPQVLELVCLPQPGGRELRLRLSQGASNVQVKLFTSAYTLAASAEAGPRPEGWSSLDLTAWRARLSQGLYFAQVTAVGGGGQRSKAVLQRVYFLR